MTGFVQRGMHRRICANIKTILNQAGFRCLPETAGYVGGVINADNFQTVTL
jgi:hypothetical protein